MNLQVIASPDGPSRGCPTPVPAGAAHDLTAARIWGHLRELRAAGLIALADKGYTGGGDRLRTPYRASRTLTQLARTLLATDLSSNGASRSDKTDTILG